MIKVISIVLMGLAVSACSDSKNATRALMDAGYSEIRTTGYSFLACSSGDSFSTGFIAKGPSGREVRGAVCSGWFKGATIRIY